MEIVSEGERSCEKLPFYADVNTAEVLIVDRDPWQLVRYRRREREMVEVGRSTLDDSRELASGVVPLRWRLLKDEQGPAMETCHIDGRQRWTMKSV